MRPSAFVNQISYSGHWWYLNSLQYIIKTPPLYTEPCFQTTWRSDYCYINKRECNLNQSKDDSFVERVSKNNSWNNGDRHKIHEIFLINCLVFVITLVWRTVHSSAMTQIKVHLMENHCNWLFPGNSPCFSWLNKETVWQLRYIENFPPQITKTAFLFIISGNRKRWNKGIVNGMQRFSGIGRTGRVFHLFCLFHLREWNSWNSGDRYRFRWTLDFYSRIEWFLFHLNWNRWSLEYLFQVFLFLKSLKRNVAKEICGNLNKSHSANDKNHISFHCCCLARGGKGLVLISR